MDEIINKVAQSNLEVFDLEDYFPTHEFVEIDFSQWLFEGVVLKEKEFREQLKNHNWAQYQNRNIAIKVPNDVIIPAWATLLVVVCVSPIAQRVVVGSLDELLTVIYLEQLNQVDFSAYNHKAVILKGCSKKPVPESAYVLAIQKLQPFAKSIMYGEACSAVPLFKKR